MKPKHTLTVSACPVCGGTRHARCPHPAALNKSHMPEKMDAMDAIALQRKYLQHHIEAILLHIEDFHWLTKMIARHDSRSLPKKERK